MNTILSRTKVSIFILLLKIISFTNRKIYASLYDKIVQGYADGTREIHVHNTGSSKGYRILTQEEELNSLNSSFGKYADGLAAQAEEEPKFKYALAYLLRVARQLC